MNETPTWLEAGVLRLDSKDYLIVRPSAGQTQGLPELAYRRQYADESPYDKGLPAEVTNEELTWHGGGFKSHFGISGTSEYGQNTDCRWPFRMLPGPKVNTLTLADVGLGVTSASTPTSFFEAFGYLFIVAGRYIWRVDPATDTVVLSKDLGAGTVGIMGLVWDNAGAQTAYVTTNSNVNSLWNLVAGGIGAASHDTWTQTGTVTSRRLARGVSRLFKISDAGVVKNIVSGLNPNVEANWGDNVQVGSAINLPNSLTAFDRTVLVGKKDGFFAISDLGFGVPQIIRMAEDLSNCYGAINWDPYILVPHSRGLYRWYPGQVVDTGIETEWLNQSAVRGRVTALAADGNGFWFFLTVGSDTYVCFARMPKGQEPSLGPMILDTVGFNTGKAAYAALLSSLAATPRLYYGYGNDAAYYKLSAGGGAPDVSGTDYLFAHSGVRYGVPMRFDDFGQKDWYKVEITGKNLTANKYWEIGYSIDGGSTWLKQDAGGAVMQVKDNLKHTFFLPRTTTAVELRPKYTFTSNSDTNPPELIDVQWFAVPQSTKIAQVSINLKLEAGVRLGEGTAERTAAEQLEDLETLISAAAPVLTYGPWGDALYYSVRTMDIKQVLQSGHGEPVYIVELLLQRRSTDSAQVM